MTNNTASLCRKTLLLGWWDPGIFYAWHWPAEPNPGLAWEALKSEAAATRTNQSQASVCGPIRGRGPWPAARLSEAEGSCEASLWSRGRPQLLWDQERMRRRERAQGGGGGPQLTENMRQVDTERWIISRLTSIIVKPWPQSARPSQTQFKYPISSKGTGADTKFMVATTPPV